MIPKRILQSKLEQLATKRDRLKEQLALFRPPRHHRPSRYLIVWHAYSKACVDYDRLWQAKTAIEKGEKNHWVAKHPKPRPDEIPVDAPPHMQTRFDWLGDLELLHIARYLTDRTDLRALFTVIPHQRQVERGFCNRIRECMALEGFVSDHFQDCEPPGFCRFPNMCPRCFIYCKGTCLQCKSSTDLRFEEPYNVHTGCDNTISAQTTGLAVKCREQISCPSCGYMYHAEEAPDVVRIRDFDCEKHDTRVGCIKCTEECKWCANIGCTHIWHYKVNPDVYVATEDWPACSECERPHCCSVFFFYRDEENKLQLEWDSLKCPVWDPVSPSLPRKKILVPTRKKEEKRRILKANPITDTCPSSVHNGLDPADCTPHSESPLAEL